MHIALEILVLLCKYIYFVFEGVFRLFVPHPKKSVRGKVVVITGGAGGIGRSLALKFAGAGAKVAVWDVNKSANEETAKNINSLGGVARAFSCDVTDSSAVQKAANETRSHLGEVDILVNNAGVLPCRRLLDLSEDEIKRTMNINAVSHFWTIREFLPHMMEQKEGHIVTVASMAGKFPAPLLSDYCASKHAAVGLSEAVRAELFCLQAKGIHVTTVCPMHVGTNLITQFKGRLDYRNRFGGIATPDEVTDAIIEGVLRNQEFVFHPSFYGWVCDLLPVLVPTKLYPDVFKFMDTGFFERKQ